MRDELFNNTAVKFVAGNIDADLARGMGVDRKAAKLQRHQFWCQWGHNEDASILLVRNDLENLHKATTRDAWGDFLYGQRGHHYRRLPKPQAAALPKAKPNQIANRRELD